MGKKGRKATYRNKNWEMFREEVIELDGEACVRCNKSRRKGTILQVHHKEYIKGKDPWDYPLKLCETLCKGCHAAEHGIIKPKHGWDFIGEDDLGALDGVCDWCGTEIRYIYFVHHPRWEPMTVGTICCDDLTGTQIASESRKFNDRLQRFYKSKRWQINGSDYLITQKKINIKIYEVPEGYKIQMNDVKGPSTYSNVKGAMKRAFEFIESGDADKFFTKRTNV